MPNLVKITDVNLYTDPTHDLDDCQKCKDMLDVAGVKYQLQKDVHVANLAVLSTQTFGPDFKQYTFTKFPIVTWKEYYDDYERWVEVVNSCEELTKSNLLKNIAVVK